MIGLSLYEEVMGEDFIKLPAPVQRFHRLTGKHQLHGRVVSEPPTSLLAKRLAMLLGTPTQGHEGLIRFELDAQPGREIWTRHFPSIKMTSTLRREGRKVIEHLGASRLTFELTASESRLVMKLKALRFFGIPCPSWLMPDVLAEESGADGRLHFKVRAAMPLIGVVASYHGHLNVPQGSPQ